MKRTFITILSALFALSCSTPSSTIDLAGEWGVKLDSLDEGYSPDIDFAATIKLPGTTDDAGLGVANTLTPELAKPQLTYLTRKNRYVGAAIYNREISIPSNWSGKDFELSLERVLWDTEVWIDGNRVEGHEESLSAPHTYDLSDYLTAGESHQLTIKVDNRKRHDTSNDMAHSYTDHTQIKWNGMIGDMTISALEKVRVDGVVLYPDVDAKCVRAVVKMKNRTEDMQTATISMNITERGGSTSVAQLDKSVTIESGDSEVEIVVPMDEFTAWSEFTPQVYTADVSCMAGKMNSEVSDDFGMRKIERVGNKMYINDKPLFLRGTLECCIFPLTGTPPMDHAGWEKVFGAARAYGLNHLRFHSWCPPKAAFEVADAMGFYIQIELPAWVLTIGKDQASVDFLRAEGDRIIAEYGNHPSFCMWSLGNELQGNFRVLRDMLAELKAKDSRHLYTTTSFTFEKGHGVWAEPGDDFFITQWTKKGWVRGQGVFNQKAPHFDKDYTAQLVGSKIPLITHEIGQYSVYPDLKEIEKYTGVLDPLNFKAIKADLERKGLIDKAEDYLLASGELAAILYKEEIERDLKTDGISGFQLLDLHDFPGQGTALVGLLNAFWESKGVISAEEFREFCSPVVPLIKFAKATYKNDETFVANIELCNYSDSVIEDEIIEWSVMNGSKLFADGEFALPKADFGYNGELGRFEVEFSKLTEATQLEVVVGIKGTEHVNRWKIWVYPAEKSVEWGDVKYTRSFAEAQRLLAKGEKVLFNPDWKSIKGIEGKFVPVFWSPVHFPKQAGTMGVLCDPNHKALSDFPTDMHTDWQWWDLNINSTTMIVDPIKGGSPVVEMIDNFANNRRLASLYEGTVDGGKLMMASFDLNSDLDNRIVARQMLSSILDYMNSSDFAPAKIENFEAMRGSFATESGNGEKEDANSIY